MLRALKTNVAINVPPEVARANDIGVVRLDWTQFDGDDDIDDDDFIDVAVDTPNDRIMTEERSDRDRAMSDRSLKSSDRSLDRILDKTWVPDVIFGCDIVFDRDVINQPTNQLTFQPTTNPPTNMVTHG